MPVEVRSSEGLGRTPGPWAGCDARGTDDRGLDARLPQGASGVALFDQTVAALREGAFGFSSRGQPMVVYLLKWSTGGKYQSARMVRVEKIP